MRVEERIPGQLQDEARSWRVCGVLEAAGFISGSIQGPPGPPPQGPPGAPSPSVNSSKDAIWPLM